MNDDIKELKIKMNGIINTNAELTRSLMKLVDGVDKMNSSVRDLIHLLKKSS
jgi:hypothetical protein